MTLPANPNTTKVSSATTAPKPKSSKVVTTSATKVVEDTRSYLAMMLLAIVMLPTGLARAYRGDKSGWTRFWIYVASNVIMIIPVLGQLLGGITILVLSIIGVFDVFSLRKTTTDAFGKPLHVTSKDKQWAHGFFVYFVTVLVLIGIIVLLVMTVIGSVIGNLTNGDGSIYDQIRSWEQQAPQQYVEPESF